MRVATYTAVASRYASFGHSEKAADVARISIETIGTIRDESAKIEGIANLSEVFEDGGTLFEDEIGSLLKLQ